LRFTGQRQEAGFGLYDYNARYYDPTLGRFVSADSIVPGAGKPQALNRYSYVFNNPLKYVDPSGHCSGKPDGPDADCWAKIREIEGHYKNSDFHVDPRNWTTEELSLLQQALAGHIFANDVMKAKGLTFARQEKYDRDPSVSAGITKDGKTLYIFNRAYESPIDANSYETAHSPMNFLGALLHELTHIAIANNPNILTSFSEAAKQAGGISCFSVLGCSLPIGRAYGGLADMPEADRNNEIVAMTVSAQSLSPQAFNIGAGGWLTSKTFTHWTALWINRFLRPEPITGPR
jgi:RHS repeat-associated protein